jgi:hypothetical protein
MLQIDCALNSAASLRIGSRPFDLGMAALVGKGALAPAERGRRAAGEADRIDLISPAEAGAATI